METILENKVLQKGEQLKSVRYINCYPCLIFLSKSNFALDSAPVLYTVGF